MRELLKEVDEIVFGNKFNNDGQRNYPPFNESMERVAQAASALTHKELTPYDVYIMMLCLKLERNGHKRGYDHMLDGLAYLVAAYKHEPEKYESSIEPQFGSIEWPFNSSSTISLPVNDEGLSVESDGPSFFIDLDGTLAGPKQTDDYISCSVIKPVADKIKELRSQGCKVFIYTARGMRTYGEDVNQIEANVLPTIRQWLYMHNIDVDGIYIGKPWRENCFYVDDKNLTIERFLNLKLIK